GDKSGNRVFGDVSQTLQRPDITLRLLVDRDVEGSVADDKANRNEVRDRLCVGGRKVTHAATGEEPGLRLGPQHGTLPDFGCSGQTREGVASSASPQTDEAGHEDRAHRPFEFDRRRYRPQRGVLQARARHEHREHGRRPCGTLFRSAEDPSRCRRGCDGDERRKEDAGAYLLYHRVADWRGRGPPRKLWRAGTDAGAARRSGRDDPVDLHRRPGSEFDRDFHLLSRAASTLNRILSPW